MYISSVLVYHWDTHPDCAPFGKPYSCFINSGFYHSARVLFDSSSLWYIYLLDICQKHFTFPEVGKEAEMQGLHSPLKINEIVNLWPFICKLQLQLLLINRDKGGTVWNKSMHGSLCHCWEDLHARESPNYDLSFPTLDWEFYTAGDEVPPLWNADLIARIICVLPQNKALSFTEVCHI